MAVYEKEITIRLSHTDAVGILFFSRIFELGDDILEGMLEDSGIPMAEAMRANVITPVVHAEADYRIPVTVGDRVKVRAVVERLGTSSITWNFSFKHPAGGEAAMVKVVQVSIDKTTRMKIPLPQRLREALSKYVEPGGPG